MTGVVCIGARMADNRLPEEGDRIAKLLARAGVASRREIERMIADGRIAINGKVLDTPAVKLANLNGVTVDGKAVGRAEAARLFAFHKPSGLITAERDPRGRPTIYDALRNALPKGAPRVMPIGRLDFNTEGLLLLTNDGGFKRLLELPANAVERTYRARAHGDVSQAQLEALIEGNGSDAELKKQTKKVQRRKQSVLLTYTKKTLPILDYYNDQKILHKIDGRREIDQIYAEISSIIGSLET